MWCSVFEKPQAACTVDNTVFVVRLNFDMVEDEKEAPELKMVVKKEQVVVAVVVEV